MIDLLKKKKKKKVVKKVHVRDDKGPEWLLPSNPTTGDYDVRPKH